MRTFILSVVFCLVCSMANAGTYYVSGAGGTYAAGDGSDGLTWAKAYTTIIAAVTAMADVDDDVIILDPTEEFVQTATIATNLSAKTGGSLHIKSETEDSTSCIISGSPGGVAHSLFANNEIGLTTNLTGITFKDHTRTNGGCVLFFGQGGNFTLTDIVADNLGIVRVGTATNALIFAQAQTFVVTINGLVIENCTVDVTEALKGVFIGSDDSDVSFVISDLTIKDSSVETSGGAGGVKGGIYAQGNLTLSGTNLFQNISFTANTGNQYGMIYCLSTSTLTMSGSTIFDNVDYYSAGDGHCFGQAITVSGAGSITGYLEAKNCDAVTGNRVTGLFLSLYDNGDLDITGPEVYLHDNTGIKGILVGSQGGRFDIDKIKIYDNIGAMSSGGFRVGGWDGATLKNCLIYNNSVVGVVEGAGGGHIQLHASATVDSTVVIDNCVFYNNSAGGGNGDGLYISENDTSGFNLTVTIRNSIFDNQPEDNEIYESTVSGDATINITYCDITGGEDSVTGADIYTDNIDADPKFYSPSTGNFALSRNSPCIDAGTDVSITYDYNGYRIPNGAAEDIGAYEYYQKYYGSAHQSVSAITADTVLKPSESGLVNVDSTAGNVAVYLPPLELSRGLPFLLYRDNVAGNTIIVYANESGGTIGGAASKTIVSKGDSLYVWGGSDQWYSDYGDIKTEDETATGTFTLNASGVTTIDSSGGAITGTLPDGTYIGQRKTIVMTNATASSTVSATHHVTFDPEVATFDAVDETWLLEWMGTEWVTIYATCTFI